MKMFLRYGRQSLELFCIFFCFLQSVVCQLPPYQLSTMVKLYELVQNDSVSPFPWSNVQNGSNPCSWNGVSCSSTNLSVVEISLSRFSVSSLEILPLLCQIDTLESIDVSNNHFTSIPDGFITVCSGIKGLKSMNFSRNQLEGFLPILTGFSMLEYLDLSRNSLNGSISNQLAGLDSLKSLNLSGNKFLGPIPTNIGKFNLLQEFQLSANSFQGEIPVELVNFSNLNLIDLSFNMLTGEIPIRFSELSSLEFLLLSTNNLSGEIPSSLSNITVLTRFAANQNRFVGHIPSGITSYLKNLDLSFNSLRGTIPIDLLSQSYLQTIDLSSNGLEGTIPANISSTLVRLRLGSNSLNGTLLSESFRNLTNLTYLELDNNKLNGPIPRELGSCRKLALLNLAQNKLSGVLPEELGQLMNLQGIYLQDNNFSGPIPLQLMNLIRLQIVNMSSNSLYGSIPNTISMLKNLMILDLHGNRLSGLLPDSFGSLESLLELQLGDNKLNGNVPVLPVSLAIALNLSNNFFRGPIPTTLSRLISLEILDLSNNNFSGEIPEFLTKMIGLTQLVLSDNQLSGTIPKFGSYVLLKTSGNKDLINSTQNTPLSLQNKKKKVSVGIVLGVATAAATAAVLITLIVVSITRRYYKIRDVQIQSEDIVSDQLVLQGNLTSNGIHRSNIDLTKATESDLDPTNMILKTKFSTYYKALMPSGVTYLVKKLTLSDKIFRSGSHERFKQELEVVGRLSNSNVMIPLAYVLTTSNAYLLYEFTFMGTLFDVLHNSSLDWTSRYSIATGIAQALAYLHDRPSGSILLIDLCSRSILLKSLYEPLVGDIELCKVIDPSRFTTSLSTVAGSVGYIPPEYAYTMRVTTAGNVYSFGVILLELLTGKQAVNQGSELANWVLKNSRKQDQLDTILDFRLTETSVTVKNQMLAVLKIALTCVGSSPDSRPRMKSVLKMLLKAR